MPQGIGKAPAYPITIYLLLGSIHMMTAQAEGDRPCTILVFVCLWVAPESQTKLPSYMALRAVEILHVQDLLSHIVLLAGRQFLVEGLPECPAVSCISRQRFHGL